MTAYLQTQPYASELIVVDDGSQDRTSAIVEEYSRTHSFVHLIRNDHCGKGYTVRTGMLAGRGEVVLFCDADLSTPIGEIANLLPWFEHGYDIVIASREGIGAHRIKEPFYRHLMGRIFNLLVRILTVAGIQDTQCGFKAFRRGVAQDVFKSVLLYGETAQRVLCPMVTAFDVEVLFIAAKRGYKIKEVPSEWIYSNETQVNPFRDSWRNFRDVLLVWWNDLWGRYK